MSGPCYVAYTGGACMPRWQRAVLVAVTAVLVAVWLPVMLASAGRPR